MNKTIQQACIALAAFVAVFIAPSATSASPELTAPTGTQASVGTFVQATNVKHLEPNKAIRLTTSIGNVECNEATLTGELTSNTGSHIAGNITTAEFRGKPSEPASQHCASPFGNVTVTPNHTTNPSHNGVSSLPWCITANTADDKFTVRGGKCSEAARNIVFTLHTALYGTCTFQMASVTGTYTTHPNVAVLSIQNQMYTRITGSNFCPGNGILDMAFTLESDDEQPQDLYVTASPELRSLAGAKVPVGTLAQGTNVQLAEPDNVRLTTSIGNVECNEATLTGELTSNTGSHIAGNITTAEFRGNSSEPSSQHCAGAFGKVTVTPNHTTNPSHNGVSSLPWCITANTADDKFTVRGGKCSEAARSLTFSLHTALYGTCSYQKASITGTYTTHPVATVLTIQSGGFTKTTGSGFCPSAFELEMAFTLETDGTILQNVYVD
jgi:hypothetical protein